MGWEQGTLVSLNRGGKGVPKLPEVGRLGGSQKLGERWFYDGGKLDNANTDWVFDWDQKDLV